MYNIDYKNFLRNKKIFWINSKFLEKRTKDNKYDYNSHVLNTKHVPGTMLETFNFEVSSSTT